MDDGMGFAKRRLIEMIVKQNWQVNKAEDKTFNFNELLFIIQELSSEEGKEYFEHQSINRGFTVFREFVKMLLYRNLANYDSMVLITSEKGCLTDDTLIEMPRDLQKYPNGVPIKDLIDKGEIYVYSYNIKTNRIEVKKSKGCEFAKIADVYEIELTNGQKIKATEDHPFLLTNGEYKQLKDLIWNEHISKTDGKISYGRIGAKLTDRLRMVVRFGKSLNNDSFKVDFRIKEKISRHIKQQKEHIFIWEQLNGEIKSGYLIHHKNGIHYDNRIENLQCLSHSQHSKIHRNNKNLNIPYPEDYIRPLCDTKNGSEECRIKHSLQRTAYLNNPKNKYDVEKFLFNAKKIRCEASKLQNGGIIKSIKYIGKKKTYDIVDVKDNKNFIANGFVVSNTGKSSAAIMMARFWCQLIGIQFNPERHIAYNNADVMNKIEQLNKFEPLICDEAIRFASSEDWAKKSNKELKKKLAQVRTKHLFYILCFPLKISKVEKTYLESFTNYWIDLFGRGIGAIYVKDRNPVMDSWRMKDFLKMGSYTEFTQLTKVRDTLKKHSNFWQVIKFPKPPKWLYDKYLLTREKNIYDEESVMANVSKEDIHNALLILALRDIMLHDTTLSMNRIILHIKNEYDLNITKGMVDTAVSDAKQLVAKVREEFGNK